VPFKLKSFADRIAALDPTLFDAIEAQTTIGDRRSLLALHQACVEAHGCFSYVEIGSYLGGSLQALIQDERCERIVSIDSRSPASLDQARGEWAYPDNTTARMRALLAALPQAELDKLVTIDASTETLAADMLAVRPAFCFIDGEHTDDAVIRDARFCQSLLAGEGWLAFHDVGIVFAGLSRFLGDLAAATVDHRAYFLPDTILVVEFGRQRLPDTPQVLQQVFAGGTAILGTLAENADLRRRLSASLTS
jgi:Methyltransferase domain